MKKKVLILTLLSLFVTGVYQKASAQQAALHFCADIRTDGVMLDEDTVFYLPPGGGYLTFVVYGYYNNWSSTYDSLNGHSIKYYICCDANNPTANKLGYLVDEQIIQPTQRWCSKRITLIHPGSYCINVYRDDKYLCYGSVRVIF